ncbi:MAG: hypothetical protein SVR08_14385, partial [Spirochaetota bacterium]|nr:hypothetical protein [Spirochaetota bacterium]
MKSDKNIFRYNLGRLKKGTYDLSFECKEFETDCELEIAVSSDNTCLKKIITRLSDWNFKSGPYSYTFNFTVNNFENVYYTIKTSSKTKILKILPPLTP